MARHKIFKIVQNSLKSELPFSTKDDPAHPYFWLDRWEIQYDPEYNYFNYDFNSNSKIGSYVFYFESVVHQ